MLMIIPYQVDVPSNRRPYVNYAIIGITIIATLIGLIWGSKIEPFFLDGWKPLGLIGHMWLQGGAVSFWDTVYFIGNLLFLWVFGNAVCVKVGHIGYAPIYIGLGTIAAVIHVLCGGEPALGAGGAINGIAGMFLVWYPVNSISCVYIIIVIIRTLSIDSYGLILAWLVFDIWGAYVVESNVIYYAHLGGFGAGAGLGIILLKTGLIRMEETERSLLSFFDWQGSRGRGPSEADIEEWANLTDFRARAGADAEIEQRESPTATPIQSKPVETPLEVPNSAPRVSEPVQTRSEKADEELIRFKCDCGKTIKAPRKYAGKSGRCPRCSAKVRIPEE
ncbi:MAG: hypothetical protein AMJ79_15635 [Phycisphaerae bacterium SM23_30]|nr:MAG: hypothetical protein AMJ79_15635 [Phycisphaerae bacterium SM23_30]